MSTGREPFGWIDIVRLGLVQAALGAMVVLTTSTLNRVMVVELALPALLAGLLVALLLALLVALLVALHYAVQVLRPRMGFGGDVGGRRTPWIVGGLCVLALGAIGAAAATAWMADQTALGIAAAFVSFAVVGIGVSAAGTNTLVLLAKRVPEARRAPAATIVWMMMIFGFAVTAASAGKLLEPYSPARLVAVMAAVCAVAFAIALFALRGLEGREPLAAAEAEPAPPPFMRALAQVWSEPQARHFTVFIFVSMIAFSAQDLILEPFAGSVFGWTPGQTTQLSGLQHGGVLAGMILVPVAGSGLLGTAASDIARWLTGSPAAAYATVFALGALLFLWSAQLARRIRVPQVETVSRSSADVSFSTPAVVFGKPR